MRSSCGWAAAAGLQVGTYPAVYRYMLGDNDIPKVGDRVVHKHNVMLKGTVVGYPAFPAPRRGNLMVQLECGLTYQATKYAWRKINYEVFNYWSSCREAAADRQQLPH